MGPAVDVRDVRRLSVSAIVAAFLVLAWLVFLFLHDTGRFKWAWPRAALGQLSMDTWLWVGTGLFVLILAVLGLSLWGVPDNPALSRGARRQVQCQGCKAVFFIQDTGKRPITHTCPSCQALGYYDGAQPAIGDPPKAEAPRKMVRLDLTCQRCKHRFTITDTGHRPLNITCKNCHATGEIQ
jgi:hypothetical protein